MRDVRGVMVELHFKTRLLSSLRCCAHPELIERLPVRERIRRHGLHDHQVTITSDNRKPGLQIDIAEIKRHKRMPLRRYHAENGPESPARIGRLRDILLPHLALHILAHTANVLAGERAIPSRLDDNVLT